MRLAQAAQNCSVRYNASSASMLSGLGRCDALWVSTKLTVSPSDTVKSATVSIASPCSATLVRSTTISGPATATTPLPPFRLVTHGTDAP